MQPRSVLGIEIVMLLSQAQAEHVSYDTFLATRLLYSMDMQQAPTLGRSPAKWLLRCEVLHCFSYQCMIAIICVYF